MLIGLPRALLYYRYWPLWETFFAELGCGTITSEESDKKILSDGLAFSIDEACLPSKIYMGHVYSLLGKCDYILTPRVVDYGRHEIVCVKFNALHDIVRNTFPQAALLDYNIELSKGFDEKSGFLKMGRFLGKSHQACQKAYEKGRKALLSHEREKASSQMELLERESQKVKILLLSHDYNIHDKLLGKPVSDHVEKLSGLPVYADAAEKAESRKMASGISKSLPWIYNRELLGSICLLKNKIDGIILVTAFPCGPDSLVNELILRRCQDKPIMNIIMDELQSETGLETRMESFMDIVRERAEKSRAAPSRPLLSSCRTLPFYGVHSE